MRTHRTHAVLAPWTVGACEPAAEHLAAVRVEAVRSLRRDFLAVDLAFVCASGTAVLPGVLADLPRIVERDRDPLVWPAAADISDARAQALAERIVPLIEPLILAGAHIEEEVFRLGPAAWFDAAREAGCFGAAPLRESLRRLAAYRWARRLARGRTVRIDAPDALGGWAMLRDVADVAVESRAQDDVLARWYGTAPAPQGRYDVAIVGPGVPSGDEETVLRTGSGGERAVVVVDPVPFDVDFAYDDAEGQGTAEFVVERVPERVAAAAFAFAASGGSSGRIAVAGRAGLFTVPDADTDEAHALAGALAAEGFDATVHAGAFDPSSYDLIHLMGVRDGRAARALADAARRSGVPVAVHAYDDDAADGGWWGAAVARWCFEYGADEADVVRYLGLLSRRAVALGEIRADARYVPPEAGANEADAVLRDAAVVFAASKAEADAVRVRTGRRGEIVVVPPLALGPAPEPVAALVGPGPFALLHAPIAPPANQLMAARAAAQARIPLVVAGPVVDASYLELVRAFGGPDLIVLAEPSAAQAAGLRAAATVVVDPAWTAPGGSRLAAGALAGAPLALSERRLVELPGAFVRTFDPGDADAIARALGEAWDHGLRTARPDPSEPAAKAAGAAFRAIVTGYAAAVPA